MYIFSVPYTLNLFQTDLALDFIYKYVLYALCFMCLYVLYGLCFMCLYIHKKYVYICFIYAYAYKYIKRQCIYGDQGEHSLSMSVCVFAVYKTKRKGL